MIEQPFTQILLLLGTAVAIVVIFLRLRIPSSLGYLLAGLLLGPHTVGPVIESPYIHSLAEFGVVFLLFTIGLNFSLPQIHALRHQVLGLGTAQVALTTLVVGLIAWLIGVPFVAALVIGAVFAQSSTTVISKQLVDQGEDNSRHGRLGLAMSVFQDVTAVPLVIIIPAFGAAAGADVLAGALGLALGKAIVAFALVFVAGRWLLRPLFHLVAEKRSAELFTLTVLFVSLIAAWTTNKFGLSMAFGAFLAGMMLGETEFRHQVESTIRPFRDVLLGLFFVGIGMLIDPASIPQIWQWVLLGTTVLLVSKTILVALIVRLAGHDALMSWRTGLLLAVGGEFGFAVLAIALDAGAIDGFAGQVALNSVLLSLIVAPYIIRYNHVIASVFISSPPTQPEQHAPTIEEIKQEQLHDHVIICGYGRIGQSVAHFLEEEGIPYIAMDLDPAMIKDAHLAGIPVYYGDSSERDILEACGLDNARFVIISHDDTVAALKALHHIRTLRPELPVMVRTRDESHVEELRAAGATEVVAETMGASLMIASQALFMLDVPITRVVRRIQAQRSASYRLLREFFRGSSSDDEFQSQEADQLRPVLLPPESPLIGRTLQELDLSGVVVTALVRQGARQLSPPPDTRLEAGDAVVLFGSLEDLQRVEAHLLG